MQDITNKLLEDYLPEEYLEGDEDFKLFFKCPQGWWDSNWWKEEDGFEEFRKEFFDGNTDDLSPEDEQEVLNEYGYEVLDRDAEKLSKRYNVEIEAGFDSIVVRGPIENIIQIIQNDDGDSYIAHSLSYMKNFIREKTKTTYEIPSKFSPAYYSSREEAVYESLKEEADSAPDKKEPKKQYTYFVIDSYDNGILEEFDTLKEARKFMNECDNDYLYIKKVADEDIDEFMDRLTRHSPYFSESLIEDFLPEDIDQAASNEFTRALGKKGDAGRYIDTDAFHKAYDQAIKDAGLSDIFDQAGLLKSRGMYGKIINCMDSVLQKALKKLWVAQYVDNLKSKVEIEQEATREKQLNQELDDFANFVKQTYIPEIVNNVRKEEPQLLDDFEKYSGKNILDAFNTEAWRSGWDMYVKYSLNIPNSDKELGHTTINKSGINDEEHKKYKIEDIIELLHKWISKYKFLNISKIIDDKLIKLGISNPRSYDTYQFIDTETKTRYKYSEDHHYHGDRRASDGWRLKKVVKSEIQYSTEYTSYDYIPVEELADINLDNLELFMISAHWGTSNSFGTYEEFKTWYYYNPNNPAELNKAGGAFLEEAESENSVTGCDFIPEDKVPAELKAIGFTAGEYHHYFRDSSD